MWSSEKDETSAWQPTLLQTWRAQSDGRNILLWELGKIFFFLTKIKEGREWGSTMLFLNILRMAYLPLRKVKIWVHMNNCGTTVTHTNWLQRQHACHSQPVTEIILFGTFKGLYVQRKNGLIIYHLKNQFFHDSDKNWGKENEKAFKKRKENLLAHTVFEY